MRKGAIVHGRKLKPASVYPQENVDFFRSGLIFRAEAPPPLGA